MISIKPGVDLRGIQPETILAVFVAASIYGPLPLVITSARDGQHMAGSLHYKGFAVDLRTKDLDPQHVTMIHTQLQQVLGAQYDVVLEADHIHVEFDPKNQEPVRVA